jgi:hypothetical protein
MKKPSPGMLMMILVSLSLNGVGLAWAAGWLAVGGLGVGLSSSSTEDLYSILGSFVCLAAGLPVLVNLALPAFALVKRSRSFLAGWGIGLLAAALLGAAALITLIGVVALVNVSRSGI